MPPAALGSTSAHLHALRRPCANLHPPPLLRTRKTILHLYAESEADEKLCESTAHELSNLEPLREAFLTSCSHTDHEVYKEWEMRDCGRTIGRAISEGRQKSVRELCIQIRQSYQPWPGNSLLLARDHILMLGESMLANASFISSEMLSCVSLMLLVQQA